MLIASDVRAYFCRDPVDMRKAIDGLSYLVEPLLAQKPASGNLFVFVARDRSKVKILYWDRTGFALWYKRLERGRFPSPSDDGRMGTPGAPAIGAAVNDGESGWVSGFRNAAAPKARGGGTFRLRIGSCRRPRPV